MIKKRFFFLVVVFSLLVPVFCSQAQNEVQDPAFATIGKAGSVWRVQASPGGEVQEQKQTLVMKKARISQEVRLEEGLYELTVKASGHRELVLSVLGAGNRSQLLAKQPNIFGYLFETPGGSTTVEIEVVGEGRLTYVKLEAATQAQRSAWNRQQQDIEQFGFITHSAQRPAPNSPIFESEGESKPLSAMTRWVVMDEPRMNSSHVKNEHRLLDWLSDNGFERLNADKIAVWMQQRIEQKDAYGSVVILAKGSHPANVMEPVEHPLWLNYIQAGGRLVSVGGLPLYKAESSDASPLAPGLSNRNAMAVLEIRYGWSSPYWGKSVPVQPTAMGHKWGFETVDSSFTGAPLESVTIAFDEYTVGDTDKKGAGRWFKNVRPDLPWSGVMKMLTDFDGNNDAMMRDVWRAANFVGKPLTIPALNAQIKADAPALVQIECTAGGMKGRREFVRGETIQVDVTTAATLKAKQVRVELLSKNQVLWSEVLPAGKSFTLATGPYTYGEYQLRAMVSTDLKAIPAQIPIGIRYIPPEAFNWEVSYHAGLNLLRADLEVADIRKTGLEVHLGEPTPASIDLMVRHGLGFSLRASDSVAKIIKTPVTEKENPEYFRRDPQGKYISRGYGGGRPLPGISHSDVRKAAEKFMEEKVTQVAKIPALRPYALCNDDFSVYYGWDYSDHVVEAFKKATGLNAPREMTKPEKFGPLTNPHPWVEWFRWTLINVCGAYNKAQTQGATQARSDMRVGPIPGGMQIPLVNMWEPAQYPPYHFGKNGFNLICSYYYNTYWQPIMTSTFWMEIGRMGNRDLPQWNMPDCYTNTGGYVRNNFFHYLAGGVKGLVYFTYDQRNAPSWSEIAKLSPIVRRISPVQIKLKDAKRDIGILNSFTSNCFDPGHTLIQAYGYHNLMQGHFDVEMVSEDEIAQGRADQYKAIVLYNIQYIDPKAYDQLKAYAARGGLVLLDTSIPFDIPGAKRLTVDIGMGQEKTRPFPAEGAHVSKPGPKDYGISARVKEIKKAVARYVKPRYGSSDIRLVYKRFEGEGIPCTWFVNAQDGKEFMFAKEHNSYTSNDQTKFKEMVAWEAKNLETKPYTTTIICDKLEGVLYDLIAQKPLPVKQLSSGKYSVELSMTRWGGTLVMWLPEEVAGVTLKGDEKVSCGQTWQVTAQVDGKTKPVPGIVPVEFTLADPQGRVSVVSGMRGTQKGQAVFEWTPAVNDPTGTWTLTATEGASGKSTIKKIIFSKKTP